MTTSRPDDRFGISPSAAGRSRIARWIAERAYRWIMRNPELAARADRILFGRSMSRPSTALVRSVFLRGLGGVYLIAFRSLHRQVLGLYGAHGILPIRRYLDAVRIATAERSARERVRLVPTVFWFDASDRALVRACVAGELCGALLMLDIAPRRVALAAWALYLSFVSTGRAFLSFQWDVLLLESGLAAAIVAPSQRDERPPWTAVMLMRMLALRLQFESGLCKLASHDPTWRDCTACVYHHETQPLPTRLGWYAHHLPRWFQRLSTALVLGIELGAPLLAFAPRRLRRASFGVLGLLQALIAASGNYGFFNVLTVVDSLWLLDDEPLARTLHVRPPTARRVPGWRRLASAAAALPVLALSLSELARRVRRQWKMPRTLERIERAVTPFRPVSSYGLFAVMTTDRPEIVIEGSADGREWREYRFRYKPVDPQRPPRFVAPHQPRLDWQMWFAAMQLPPSWFERLLERLLEGTPEVLALLDENPFPDGPPRYVRALLYDYRMTDRATQRRTGAWWRRELRGLYFPPVSLDIDTTSIRD